MAENPLLDETSACPETLYEESHSVDRYSTFVKFCKSGLGRLGLHDSQHIKYSRVWKEAEEFSVSLSLLSSLLSNIYFWLY